MTKAKRLESLDALRGFDMFFIAGGGGALLIALSFLLTGTKDAWLAVQMDHVVWEGLHLYDLIFPLFVFITGVTFPFSTEKRLERGEGRRGVVLNILRRAFVLVALGALYSRIQFCDWPTFRIWSVIGRIGLVWGSAALLSLFFRVRTCVAISVAILVGWWLLLRFVPAPDMVAGGDPLGCHANCFAVWFDVHYLTCAHRFEGGLTTVAMLPTAFLGIWAGKYLKAGAKVSVMYLVAAALALVGWLWTLPSWGMPICKEIWSGPFVLVSGAVSIALLALFHWLIDVKGWKSWAFFFRVIGVNAIAVYFSEAFMQYGAIAKWWAGALPGCCALPGWEPFVLALFRCAVTWLMLYFLYRRNIFFKV